MIKKYIIVALLSILIAFNIVTSIKCTNLEKENIKLKLEETSIVDSFKLENEILEKNIKFLEKQVIKYEHKVDSLEHVKRQIIVKTKYIISKDITEGVALLKDNLECEK